MSDPTRTAIKAACEIGMINHETMAAALDDEPRAVAYVQWKLDGNDGPASPPEWFVDSDSLTDEQIESLTPQAEEWIDWPNRQRLRLGWYLFDARQAMHDFERKLARKVCAHAINARRSKETTNA